ncbi:hypothetical protein D3C80_1281450 [compost metagenome]
MPTDNAPDGLEIIRHGKFDIDLGIAPHVAGEGIRRSITRGWYEAGEAETAISLVKPTDRVLELGGGIGFISTVVTKNCKPAGYIAVEADARLLPIIAKTHRMNDVSSVQVRNCIVTSDPATISKGHCDFTFGANFWGSSAHIENSKGTTVSVPVFALSNILAETGSNIIIADIEGGELELFLGADLSTVRGVMMEIHPAVIGQSGVAEIFNYLHRQGLIYNTKLSAKEVVAFTRE